MDVELAPEPEPDERAAILAALEAVAAPPAHGAAWREAALREGVGETDEA